MAIVASNENPAIDSSTIQRHLNIIQMDKAMKKQNKLIHVVLPHNINFKKRNMNT